MEAGSAEQAASPPPAAAAAGQQQESHAEAASPHLAAAAAAAAHGLHTPAGRAEAAAGSSGSGSQQGAGPSKVRKTGKVGSIEPWAGQVLVQSLGLVEVRLRFEEGALNGSWLHGTKAKEASHH